MTSSWRNTAGQAGRRNCGGKAGVDLPGYILCRLSEDCAAAIFALPVTDLRGPSRGHARAAFARQVAMYLAHVACGLNMTGVGAGFDRDRTTVAHACAVVEDSRDDPVLDRMLDRMENALALIRQAIRSRSVSLACRESERRHERA